MTPQDFAISANFFGKLLTGDGGAYLISFITGYFLIDLANSSERVSPYFVACLLWYPAYENLFSIIRKKVKATNRQRVKYIDDFIKSKVIFGIESLGPFDSVISE